MAEMDDEFDVMWKPRASRGNWFYCYAYANGKCRVVSLYHMYHTWIYYEPYASRGDFTIEMARDIFKYIAGQYDNPLFRLDMTDIEIAESVCLNHDLRCKLTFGQLNHPTGEIFGINAKPTILLSQQNDLVADWFTEHPLCFIF